MSRNRFIIRITLAVLVILGIASYGYFEARAFVRGPVIEVREPQDGSKVNTSVIQLNGTTRNISKITLNERSIFVTPEGDFSETLVLMPGYNIITLWAQNRFGKETRTELSLIYSGTSTPLIVEDLSPPLTGTGTTSTSTLPRTTTPSSTTTVQESGSSTRLY